MTNEGMAILELMGRKGDQAARPIPEAQIATLREAAAAYAAPCRFKVGDVVTPTATSFYTEKGVPHVVIETTDRPFRCFDPDAFRGSVYDNSYGGRLDIRVAVMTPDGIVVTYWQESWQHEYFFEDREPAGEKTPAKPSAGDEWIEWTGEAGMPVIATDTVEIMKRDGSRVQGIAADFAWKHRGANFHGDIMKYRMIKMDFRVDDWIEWTGGNFPVCKSVDDEVRVELASGKIKEGPIAAFYWFHFSSNGNVDNIVRYKRLR